MKRKDLLKSREYWIANIQLSLYEMMEQYGRENKLNKTQLAEKLGVTKGYVSQILNGTFDHKISKLVDIALKLDKVPILKYESMEQYIMHDSLNITTTIGIVKNMDFTYDFSIPKSYQTQSKVYEKGFTDLKGNNEISLIKSPKEYKVVKPLSY